jgi:multidrug resistance efflux pump
LFERYEFPKEAEKLLSDYVEKLRKLQRTRKESESKLAQAEAKLRSAEARFEIEGQQLKEIQEQLEKCKIHAERPGLVVYGGGNDRWYGEERIQEGATVRERQMIITIPDMTKMSVTLKIHESDIKKVAVGQKATITVDAFPDVKIDGEVIKVGVLPDAEQRWMNPDLKVYETSVRVDAIYDWLKPGMSAETEIMIDTVESVIYVPVQAVHVSGDDRVCYVSTATGPRRQVVTTGAFTDQFIEIKEGVVEGDVIFLVTPEGMEEPEPALEDTQPAEPEESPESEVDVTGETVVTSAASAE